MTMPEFITSPVTVRVPATSANLGPGFDSFGLALGRYDVVTAEVAPSGLQIAVTGEGSATSTAGENHLVVKAMRATFDRLGGQPSGLVLSANNRIPHGRGLGSSAAAIVAGILLARTLTAGGEAALDEAATLALASEIEGHPDNVAACLLGGFTLAWTGDDSVARAVRLEPHGVRPVVFIPTDESSTAKARAALPAQVSHKDAVFNLSRASLLTIAMTGRPDLLTIATEDRLHQNYRAGSMPASSTLVGALRKAGLAAVISGAGSTVLALCASAEQVASATALAPTGWECAQLDIGAAASATVSA